MRKVYVGEILKQTEVTEHPWTDQLRAGHYFAWDYEIGSKFGLFVKTLGGYKNILTNKIYRLPSKRTGKKYVINPENVQKFSKYDQSLYSRVVEKYDSVYVDYHER